MTHSIELDRWFLRDFDPGQGTADTAGEGEGWIPILAPGDVHLALVEAGRLAHPYRDRNETQAAWIRDREWWWTTTFLAPEIEHSGDVVELVFEGLDTFASIHLDGRLIGCTDNMFRRHVFDIGPLMKPGTRQRLAVRFDPPSAVVPPGDLPVWTAFTDRVSRSRRNLMRKAQFGWGWDWGPDLPTVGLWRPARIEVRPAARLTDVRFATEQVSDAAATASIDLDVDAAGRDAPLRFLIQLTDPDGQIVFETTEAATGPLSLPVRIDHPRLWWTADLGDQPLYALTVRLLDADRPLDEVRLSVGLRTIAIDQSPDPDEPGGTFFRFVLNGVPIFAKGACWVPTTSFIGDVDSEPYDRLIDDVVGANMNMIRVWGGGIYEPDIFYDLCDRRGVLVWQDFMFACAHYPEDDAFAASVRAEVEDQVRRLRHHPCLALWCGNNESQAMNRINTDMGGDPVALSGVALYDQVIPDVLARLDPATPYRPGSPWGGSNPNSMREGDVHNWTVWHGLPPIPDDTMIGDYAVTPEGIAYTRYAEDQSRFVSEFGIQAAPALATLQRWMGADDLTPDSPGFLERIKDEARKADAMMATVTGAPTTLQDYVDFTQWTQAEGLKFGIEHFRRRTPHCSGALIWQFNDCWPCVSWSLVDYDGVQKAGWFAVRRAFAPVLASFKALADGEVELWITNDTRSPVSDIADIRLSRIGGETEWRLKVQVSVAPLTSRAVWRGHTGDLPDGVLSVRAESETFAPNRTLLGPIVGFPLLRDAAPGMDIRRNGDRSLEVRLSADAYLPFVHLVSARMDLRFSDNYFDMAAGDHRTIAVTARTDLGPEDIAVRSWNDTTP